MPKMEDNKETKVDETKVDEVEETGDESENLETDNPEGNDPEPDTPSEMQLINERINMLDMNINIMQEKLGMLTDMLIPLSEKLDNFVQDMNVIKPNKIDKPQATLEELSKNFL